MTAESLADLTAESQLDLLATGVIFLDAALHTQALNLSAATLMDVSARRAVGSHLTALLDQSDARSPLLRPSLSDT